MSARLISRQGVTLGPDVKCLGKPIISVASGSTLVLGARVVLCSAMRGNTLEARGPVVLRTLFSDSVLKIGDDTGLTSATVSCAKSVEIGDRVLIGGGVIITDSDHHFVESLGRVRRFAGFPPPRDRDAVEIGSDVFIGARTIVLKGVKIGEGTVIGAGSVVSENLPSKVVAAGNPCRVVKQINRLQEKKTL